MCWENTICRCLFYLIYFVVNESQVNDAHGFVRTHMCSGLQCRLHNKFGNCQRVHLPWTTPRLSFVYGVPGRLSPSLQLLDSARFKTASATSMLVRRGIREGDSFSHSNIMWCVYVRFVCETETVQHWQKTILCWFPEDQPAPTPFQSLPISTSKITFWV